MASCETGETDVSLDAQTHLVAGQLTQGLLMEMRAPPLDLTFALASILEHRNRLTSK